MIFVCEILQTFDSKHSLRLTPHLLAVATLPWNIQKSHFKQYCKYIRMIICVIFRI